MTISDELETLMQTKKNIKTAITNKGVSIPSGTPFADYPDAINAISGEGGSYVDLSDYATKDYVDNAIANIELIPGPQGEKGEQGPAGKDADPVDLDGYATKDYVDEAIANIEVSGGGDVNLKDYVTKEEYDEAMACKSDVTHNHDEMYLGLNSLKGYATESYVQEAIGNIDALLDALNGEVL